MVGILLGETSKGRLDITNSYAGASVFQASVESPIGLHAPVPSPLAVPFEEDDRDNSVWFLDHSYHEQMYRMSRRINGAPVNLWRALLSVLTSRAAGESVVGWYSTGPKVREVRAGGRPCRARALTAAPQADLDIHDMICNYSASPVLVIIDVQPQELGLPTSAYTVVEEIASVRDLLFACRCSS